MLWFNESKGLWVFRSPPAYPKKEMSSKDLPRLKERIRAFYREEDGAADLLFDARALTVSEYLDRWLEEAVRRQVAPSTHARYRQDVEKHLKPALGEMRLADLTKMHVQALVNRKESEGYAASTVRRLHACLSKALSQAVEWELVGKSAAAGAKLPRNERKRRDTLPREAVPRFFGAAKGDRFEALYAVAVLTGARPGELLAMRWGDLDLGVPGGTWVVRATVSDGEDGKPRLSDRTKTGRDRAVSLPPTAVAALKSHKARQNAERLELRGAWRDQDLVFPDSTGGIVRRQNLRTRHYKPLLKKAGLPEGIRMHDLRHTFATLMRESGEDLKTVSDALGHASIKTTGDTYTHRSEESMRAAAERFEGWISGQR
jgi:integrase